MSPSGLRRRRQQRRRPRRRLRVPGGASLTRGEIDEYTKFVGIYGAKGLAHQGQRRHPGQRNRPAVADRQEPSKRLAAHRARAHRRPVRRPHLLRRRQGQDRQRRLGALRIKLGHERASSPAPMGPAVGHRFPDVRIRRRSQALDGLPPPFTSPKDEHMDLLVSDPGKCPAKAYDLALNGWELGGGSVRIHRSDVQERSSPRSPSAGRTAGQVRFLLDALKYGAPRTAASPSASTASSP